MGNKSSAEQANVVYADAAWPEIEIDESRSQPVGTVLGTHAGIPVYSCGYFAGIKSSLLYTPSLLIWNGVNSKTEEGFYCGFKWQCVELARRYLIKTRNLSVRARGGG